MKGDENELLRSVALQNANSILVARQRAERRSEAYLAEAQRLSRTGSFGWRPSTGEIFWSEETFRIFQFDRTALPTPELILQRIHPEDAALVKQIIERASQDGKDFEHEYRLVMPDGAVKHVHVVAHAERDESGEFEFVGAVMDVSDRKRAEEALRRSESYLAEAQRLTHTGSWAWRIAGRDAVHLSEEWYRINGFDPEKGILTWEERLQRIHPEDQAKWQDATGRAIAEKSDYEVEVRILLPDGTVKHVRTVGHPVLNSAGDLVQFVGSSTDITERKRAEVLLAGEKRLLEMIARGDSRELILEGACLLVEELASGSLSSILLLDPTANCLRHGAAPSLPKTYTDAIDGAVIGPSVGSCGTAAYWAEPVIVSDIATDPLWADFRDLALAHELRACWSTPILSSAGRVLGTFATYYREPRSPSSPEHNVIERITHLASIAIERKRADEERESLRAREQAALAESVAAQQRFLDLVNSVEGIVWEADVPSFQFLFISKQAERVLGYPVERWLSEPAFWKDHVHPEDREWALQFCQSATAEKRDHEFEYRMIAADARVVWLRDLVNVVMEGDRVTRVRGLMVDLTNRKHAEEALRQAQADLAHVNRVTTMGELTASLAHEVTQPIAAAVTNANTCLRWLARDHPDLEEARAAAMRIVKDGTRASEIISRIRQLFKKDTPQRELVDVNEVIHEMGLLLRNEATRYSISIRTDLAADRHKVMADRVQLQQVFMNLMLNGIDAMKDMDAGGELTIKSLQAGNGQMLISVSDTGVGLPAQQMDKIFNAFYTTKPEGTGMGLSISRSIVESHGGRLWAAHNSPRGASFYISLPTKVETHE